MKVKKKFKDTKIGKFLLKVAPDVLDSVSEVVPDFGALKVVGNLIEKHPTLSAEEKVEATTLIAVEEKSVKKKKLIDKGKIIAAIIAALGVLISVSESCLNEVLTAITSLF